MDLLPSGYPFSEEDVKKQKVIRKRCESKVAAAFGEKMLEERELRRGLQSSCINNHLPDIHFFILIHPDAAFLLMYLIKAFLEVDKWFNVSRESVVGGIPDPFSYFLCDCPSAA